jgi:hypothetical protein
MRTMAYRYLRARSDGSAEADSMDIELYVGVISDPHDLLGMAIRTATEVRGITSWVLGPKWPATHAFVAWRHGQEADCYQLDAEFPRAKLSYAPLQSKHPLAVWRVNADADALRRGHVHAVGLAGVPYDLSELALQLGPGIVPLLRGVPDALICSAITRDVLRAVGGAPRVTANAWPDLMPERIAQSVNGSTWSTRVV